MSKIICDICGTSYADTATQCPICGCVRPAEAQSVPNEETKSSGYTYVKGGRFSKANVKKRNTAEKTVNKKENSGKKGIAVILILILLLGVIAFGVAAWYTNLFGLLSPDEGAPAATPAPTEPTAPQEIPCTGLVLSNNQYTLAQVGDAVLIGCRVDPVDSTDNISYISENEEVATVDANGKVTAVQNGTTKILITCGDVTASCDIIVGDGNTSVELVLDFTTITFTTPGETKVIYSGTIPVENIKWESDNEVIASVVDGVVTANKSGPATITATYMDKTVTCDVLCDLGPTGGNSGITEDGGGIGVDGGNNATSNELAIYYQYGLLSGNDATIPVGQTIDLYLGNSSGTRIELDWTCTANDYITISGNTIKAVKSNNSYPITVSTEHEGKVYKCIIRTCLP